MSNFKDFEVLQSIDMFVHGTSDTCAIQQERRIPNNCFLVVKLNAQATFIS